MRVLLDREEKEKIAGLKKSINMQAARIALLKEDKFRDISKHSEEWQSLFHKIHKDILEWFSLDRQFIKNGMNPLVFYGRRTGKEDRINVVIFNTVEDYKIERAGPGGFISYQAVRIKSDIRDKLRVRSKVIKTGLEKEEKKKSVKIPINELEKYSTESGDFQFEEYCNILNKLEYAADKIEEFYTKSKAGQKAKSNVFTFYFIKLGFFLIKEGDILDFTKKYSFLNKDAVHYFYYSYKNIINQKVFAEYTGTRTTKFSVMTAKIKEYFGVKEKNKKAD